MDRMTAIFRTGTAAGFTLSRAGGRPGGGPAAQASKRLCADRQSPWHGPFSLWERVGVRATGARKRPVGHCLTSQSSSQYSNQSKNTPEALA